MAARLNPKHDEKTRLKIKTSQLVNRLQTFALRAAGSKTKKSVEMSDGQIRAALGLLKKTLPDLQSTELDVGGEIVKRVVNAEPMSEAEWTATYGADDGEAAPKPVH